ncbi:MAG: hypothetical protein MJY91_09975 [Bacteroidales bacterium]|nr:hypothetical protein [Bacteroidales bacterium]
MENSQILDKFESVLEAGLLKICNGAGILDKMLISPDLTGTWEKYLKDYVADAVENFNQYPEAAVGFASFLGMAVANNWDADWTAHKDDSYQSYYGSRGFDDMDDHIIEDVLHLKADYGRKVSDTMMSCAIAALGLISHEGIETQTELGFYILNRCYSVMFRIGAAVELQRLGYRSLLLAD